jgi:hypothetical protein
MHTCVQTSVGQAPTQWAKTARRAPLIGLLLSFTKVGVPVANVQETSIRASVGKTVEANEGLHPRLSWKKSPNFSDN